MVLIVGPRQAGKTTLTRELLSAGGLPHIKYATLDDLPTLAQVKSDPLGFIAQIGGDGRPAVIDEVQRVPDLLVTIKASVDRDRRPGRFLLTGSANVLTLPKVSDSLAGRIEILTLWPLSQAEIAGVGGSLVDRLFDETESVIALPPRRPLTGPAAVADERAGIVARALTGGYPEAIGRSPARRRNWFDSYVRTVLQRDIREIANIQGIADMPRLLGLLASRTAGILNVADISRTADVPTTTLQRYLCLLEAIYLIRRLPAWSINLGIRHVKSPKVLFGDTGLAAHLMGVTAERLERDPSLLGGILENFVAMELAKDITWSQTAPGLYHWRTEKGEEVDLLLEARDGRLVGIEVKAGSTVTADAFKGLKRLQAAAGDRFFRGIVFYTGSTVYPFGENLYAVPMSVLWERQAAA